MGLFWKIASVLTKHHKGKIISGSRSNWIRAIQGVLRVSPTTSVLASVFLLLISCVPPPQTPVMSSHPSCSVASFSLPRSAICCLGAVGQVRAVWGCWVGGTGCCGGSCGFWWVCSFAGSVCSSAPVRTSPATFCLGQADKRHSLSQLFH